MKSTFGCFPLLVENEGIRGSEKYAEKAIKKYHSVTLQHILEL